MTVSMNESLFILNHPIGDKRKMNWNVDGFISSSGQGKYRITVFSDLPTNKCIILQDILFGSVLVPFNIYARV